MKKLLDTGVRISKSTRAKLNAHCRKNDLQVGRFADSAILAVIDQAEAGPVANGRKPKAKKAATP